MSVPPVTPDTGATPLAAEAGLRIGSAHYLPVRLLAAGPDGTRFLARNAAARGELVELRHATVALQDPERWLAIDAIAKIYALLDHEGWRRLLQRGVVGDTPVLVFDGALERDLGARVALGPLPELDACLLVERLAEALNAAHRLGLVHGTLGPSAVLLDDLGTPLLDFPWLEVGTTFAALDAACAPPERDVELLDASSDVYALGMLLRVLLTGGALSAADSCGALDPLLADMTSVERDARPSMRGVASALRAHVGTLQQTRSAEAPTLSLPAQATLGSDFLGELGGQAAPRLALGSSLGRFELIAKIGEGGMGEVYRARDRATDQLVALKVLRQSASHDPGKLQRFRKEARILSELRSPYVARLIEVNRDSATEFMALELIDGQDLADFLHAHAGRLTEREALSIVADVCRGLSEAHAQGIVHRDIKPENVMIARADATQGRRVKLCDFGIARALDGGRSATLAFTQDDRLLGTPEFMAPEQCTGGLLSPATDVYALGITLFSLIAGRVPFVNSEPMALLYAHTSKEPPTLASLAPEVSEATSALVARMLQKAPADRFADASMVLEQIERIVRGDPTSIEVHPVRPSTPGERIVQHVFEWELRASPQALWPFVSNTDRLNRAVGLPPALFERLSDATGVETRGKNRVAGVDLRWREHPFEWIEGRRWGVLRTFDSGVMHWFTIELELFPKPGGGTRLRYSMTLSPRHLLGRMIVAIELRGKQRAALGKAFARIDAYASADVGAAPGSDPFEAPAGLPDANRAQLERGLGKLRSDGVQDDMLDALAAFCERASAQEIARLRPLAFARTHMLDPDRLVDACLRAAHHGVLVLLWDLLCPLCRVPSDFVESLQALKDHGRCPSCNVDFPLDFTQSLELVFRVSPEIRLSDLRTYCVGGPAFAPHVVAQVRLRPSERLVVDLALGNGAYKVRSPQLPDAIPLQISSLGRSHRGGFRFEGHTPSPDARVVLGPGAQSISLENMLDREIVVRIERSAPREDALTAARAACLASFRKLFPGEVLASGRLVAVGRTAFLITNVHGQRALLEQLGDARAFEQVLQVLSVLEEIVEEEGGAVVKTASGTTLSAFDSTAAAVRAAITLRERLDLAVPARRSTPNTFESSSAALRQLDVRIVVHEGPAVAATFDGRLDYFGRTVEDAVDLLAHAPARQVLLSTSAAQDPNTLRELEVSSLPTTLVEIPAHPGFAMLLRAGQPLEAARRSG